MTEPTKRPTGAAVAAALSPFIGLPLTFVFFILAVGIRGGDEYGGGPLSSVSEAWMEGGWGMYLVLGAGGLVATICAILLFFGVQRGSGAVMACAPLASMLVAAGAFAYWNGMNQVLAALGSVSAADRATILAAGTSEALTTTLLGLCAMAGLLSSLCLGLLLGVIAQQGVARRLLLAATGVFGSLVIVAAIFATRLQELMGSFKAVAHASPLDRLTILVGVGQELERYRVFLLAALVFVLVMAALGAVLVKDTPRLAVLVPLLGLAGLFGFGIQELARKSFDRLASSGGSSAPLGLLEVQGYASMDPRWCIHGKDVVECEGREFGPVLSVDALADELAANVRSAADGFGPPVPTLALGLAKDADAATTWKFVSLAAQAGFRRVSFIGETTNRKPREVPSELKVVVAAMESPYQMVPVDLAPMSNGCTEGCLMATASPGGLMVGKETWKPGVIEGWENELQDRVALKYDGSSPAEVVKFALAAATHRRKLVLLAPDDLFSEDKALGELGGGLGTLFGGGDGLSEDDEEEARALLERVFGADAGTVPTFGGLGDDVADEDEPPPGLPKDEIAKVVKQHLNEMKLCYEKALQKNPSLAGKVVLRWVVKPNGSVADVEVSEDTLKDASAVACLAAKPAKWKFPKPTNKGEVVVRYPFSFKAAQ